MKKYAILMSLFVAVTFMACNDDTGVRSHDYSDGIYFNFSSRDWSANGSKSTRVVSIQEMTSSERLDDPLYLHCEVTEGILPPEIPEQQGQGDTRAVRYTGPVFNESYGVTSFGIYGTVGAKTAFYGTEVFTRDELSGYDNGSQGSVYAATSWREKESQTINEYWLDGETGDFYGFAPSPYEGGGSVNSCVSVDFTGTPTLTYDMPADAGLQRDVLTAKKTTVTKAEKNEFGIELEFSHVLTALRFKVAYDANHPENSLKWSLQNVTYYVQPRTIAINDIYSKGSCHIQSEITSVSGHWTKLKADPGDADYKKCALTTCTISQTRAQILANGGLITPDANCFMVLPQEIENGVKAVITCDLYSDEGCTALVKENVRIEAPLYGTCAVGDGWGTNTKLVWNPGYTYTYTISDIDVAYVFDYNTATAKNYNGDGTGVDYYGTSEEDVFIRSYKVDSKGNKTNVKWWPEYEETEADAVGVGDGGADETLWKKGSNGWIHVYDHSTGAYDTEVLTDHGGAHEGESDDIRLFKIAIGTIMEPVKDLSMWNYDQTKHRRKRCTSNCYVVAGPGTYVIPLVYGNGITNGAVNTKAFNPGVSQNNAFPKFKNAFDKDITSPYINQDLHYYGYNKAEAAALIWAEGDAASTAVNGMASLTLRQSYGSDSGHPAGYTETDAERAARNEGTVIKVIPDIDENIYDSDGYNTSSTYEGANYIKFEVKPEDFNYGNAVIGVRNAPPVGDNIVWSWHIWLVDPDWFIKDNTTLNLQGNNITYANTNIGYVPGNVSVAAQNRTGKARLVQKESGKIITIDAEQKKRRAFTTYFTNVLYQWGRKDPIRGNVNPDDMNTDYGAPRGPKGYRAFKNNMEVGGENVSIFVTSRTATIGEMIRTPNTMYGQSDGDLYNYGGNTPSNLWAATLQKYYITNGGTWLFHGKTIYDPSPVGYCVPPSKCLTKLRRGGFGDISTSTQTETQVKQRGIICTYTANSDEGSGKTLQFHATGIRTTTAGYDLKSRGLHQPGALNAANGFYHTATPFTDDENWQLHLYFYPGVDTHNFIRGDLCECLSVKPVLWDGEIDNIEEVDLEKEYLTFTFEEASSLYWQDNLATTTSRTIYWSTDKTTWNSVTSSNSGTRISGADFAAGTKVYVKGTNNSYCSKDGLGVYRYNYFRSTGGYALSGNIMSLIYGDSFIGMTGFPAGSDFNFCSLFYNPAFGSDTNETLNDVDGLVLPATSLTESCYESLFEGCKSLISAPYLPAETGATNCYKNMYKSCSGLTTIKSSLASPSSTYTNGWANGVASSGSFFYKKGTTWPTGNDGIPSGWASYPTYD